MAKRLLTKQVKSYIYWTAKQRGSVSAEDVAEIIQDLHIFDPVAAEKQWCRDRARKLIADWKDEDGIRILFATGTGDAEYVNIETCQEPFKLAAVRHQLTQKKNGITRALKKSDRCMAVLTGQSPLFGEPRDESTYFDSTGCL